MALHITVGLLAIAGALLALGTAHTAGGLLLGSMPATGRTLGECSRERPGNGSAVR